MTETMYPSTDIDLTQSASPSSTPAPSFDLSQLKTSASDRVVSERDKFTETLRSFTDELREMQSGSSSQGPATALIGQAADRSDQVLSYVESRDPQQLLNEARNYASSHPVMFLAGAAVVGGVLGRLSRTAAAASRDADLTPSSSGPSNGVHPFGGEGDPASTTGIGA